MVIKNYDGQINECIELWNKSVESGEVVFKPLDKDSFNYLFLKERNYTVINFVGEEDGKVIAFGSANFGSDPSKPTVAYITYIGVLKEYRGQGKAKEMLAALEAKLQELKPELEKIELVFYNPCQLSWFIPGKAPHDHAGTPGVDMDSDAYKFFGKMGYEQYSIQNTYYLELKDYTYPDAIVERLEKLKESDIEVCYFDKDRHHGFPEFFDNIKNEGWRRAVLSRLDEDIVISAHNGMVTGYTGPLAVSPTGRGTFCGIGVHTEYRKHGIGKALFAALCKGLSEKGATFMSLFTGDTNPARYIYEGAGFKICRSFATMRKTLNK